MTMLSKEGFEMYVKDLYTGQFPSGEAPGKLRALLAHGAEQRRVIDRQAQQIATLREALGKLVKEIDGILGIGEEQIRNIVGNTNVNVLHVKIATAQQALKEHS